MRRGSGHRRRGCESEQAEKPSWMWTRRGMIRLIGMDFDGKQKLGLPVFRSFADAKASITADDWGRGTRPAKIGSVVVEGCAETLEGILFGHVVGNGIEFMGVGRRKDGETEWEIVPLPSMKAGGP